jgi:hypothetical protein
MDLYCSFAASTEARSSCGLAFDHSVDRVESIGGGAGSHEGRKLGSQILSGLVEDGSSPLEPAVSVNRDGPLGGAAGYDAELPGSSDCTVTGTSDKAEPTTPGGGGGGG